MTLEKKIEFLRECIVFNTQDDIYQLPREEFKREVAFCQSENLPPKTIPFAVLMLLLQEEKTLLNKIKRLFRWKK